MEKYSDKTVEKCKRESVLKRRRKQAVKPFKVQLRRTFVCIILIPIVVLGGVVFCLAFSSVNRQRMQTYESTIDQCQLSLEGWISQCENSLNYITANYSLQQFLQMDKKDTLVVNQQAKTVSAFLYNVQLSNSSYKDIHVYTDKNFNGMDALVTDSSLVEQEEWYQALIHSAGVLWWYDDETLCIGKRIMTAYPEDLLGVVTVTLKKSSLKENVRILEEIPAAVSIKQEADEVARFVSSEKSNGRWCRKQEHELGSTGLEAVYEIRQGYFYGNLVTFMALPMCAVILVLIAAWIGIRYSVKYLEHDLGVLVKQIQTVQTGDFAVQIISSRTLEINQVGESVQLLLNKINQLISQVYEQEIQRQKMELDLLQAKINPHFLYNSLSAINWLAIDCGQDKISEITTNLAQFYRTALNKGRTVDQIHTEVENIKAYVRLQQIARDFDFDVEWKIDEKILGCFIPVFIMQPLLENAIEHGIASAEGGKGRIRVIMEGEGKNLHFAVRDNGNLLYKEIGTAELDKLKFGYGLSNVDRRIRLICGESYGVFLRADAAGTTAELKLCEVLMGEGGR